jgi:hypothetical protein
MASRTVLERKRNEEKLLDDERRKNRENQKSAVEQKLREQNGVRARALMNDIQDYVRSLAEKGSPSKDALFSSYSNWLSKRFSDQWQTFEVSSDVADFGTVQWNGRTLDAIIVKTVIQQKNRILGQYSRDCFMFGLVDDVEFSMQREPFSVDCDNGVNSIKNWIVGKRFQSQWNAN